MGWVGGGGGYKECHNNSSRLYFLEGFFLQVCNSTVLASVR